MYRTCNLLVIFFFHLQCSPEHQTDRDLPNILLILTDDQGWGDVGFHDNSSVQTPNLDKLAGESVEFTRFYVSPVCAPTRASLLTGRYHLATGVSWVTHRREVMRESEVTIAELLKAHGYRTGLFGKWHNGKQFPHDPNGQGFSEFLGFEEGHFNNYFDALLTHNQRTAATTGYLPDVLTDSAISFMQREGPFFCYLAYNTPHSPFQVPDAYFDLYKDQGLDDKMAAVYGMVTNIDDNIGRLMKALENSGKHRETIVVFLSDNGPNGHRYNGGFKGIKAHVDEGGVRVPFLIRYPERSWDNGTQISSMAAHIDVLPTLAEFTGLSLPDSLEVHGKSLVGTIEKQYTDTSRYFFTHHVRRAFDTIPGAVRTNRFLLSLKPEDTSLYDLINDPFQKTDLVDSMPEQVLQLKKKYHDWFARVTKEGIEPESVEIGHSGIPVVEFPAQEVTSRENVRFKGSEGWANDYLIDWKDGSTVTWTFRSVAAKEYEILVQASCSAGAYPQINLRIGEQELTGSFDTLTIKRPVESPDRVKRGEVYEYNWPEVSLGKMIISEGVNRLELTAFDPHDLEVKSVILKLIEHDE